MSFLPMRRRASKPEPPQFRTVKHTCPKCGTALTTERIRAERNQTIRQPYPFACRSCTEVMREEARERRQTEADLGFLAFCAYGATSSTAGCCEPIAFGFDEVIAALSNPNRPRCARHTGLEVPSC